MTRPPRLARLLVALLRFGPRRAEIEDDLSELFALRVAERGRTAATVRYCLDALSVWRVRRSLQAIGSMPHRRSTFHMIHDIIYAVRLFRRQPFLFSVTILGLALAIGLSTVIFSVVRPFVFPQSGVGVPQTVRRVWLDTVSTPITGDSPSGGNWAYSDYLLVSRTAQSLSLTASMREPAELSMTPRDSAAPVAGRAVSGGYFPTLQMAPAEGRLLGPQDDAPGRRSVVLSYGFWKNTLRGDRSIVGQSLWLNGDAFTVVGVASRAASEPGLGEMDTPPAFWIPLAASQERWNMRSASRLDAAKATLTALKREARTNPALTDKITVLETDLAVPEPAWNPAIEVLGRLKAGVTETQAEAEINSIAASIMAAGARDRRHRVDLQPVDDRDDESIEVATGVIGIAALVLFLACANVTNVLLANAAARRREIGTRLALGASRGRLVAQLLTESVLLGLAGGAIGLAAAIAIAPAFASYVQLPAPVDVSPDAGVYLFVAGVTLAAGMFAGVAPARFGRRGNILASLQADPLAAPTPLPRSRLRSVLVGGQATISVLLLVLAALLARSLGRSLSVNPGFDPATVMSVTASSGPGGRNWSAARATAFWHAGLDEVRQLPGVGAAALVEIPPFSGMTAPDRSTSGRRISRNETSAGYFEALGIRVLRGRAYNVAEVRAEAPVAVISDRLARDYWPNEDPIGSSLERVWGAGSTAFGRTTGLLRRPKDARIIGVVSDTTTTLRDIDAPTIYLPLSAHSHPRLVVRSQGDRHALGQSIADALRRIEPAVNVTTSIALDGYDRELQVPKILALLGSIVAGFAVVLATIGLFGVTAFVVGQRRHEVSVRKTLGATDVVIIRMLLSESLRPVIVGLGFGLLFAFLAGQLVQAVLFGVSGRDPIAILAAVLVLLTSAFVAVWGPARRAASANPAQVLKVT